MVRVAVTGAAGYIGSAVVSGLVQQGHQLILVDNGTGAVFVERPGQPILREDYASAPSLAAIRDADVVLHLAAVGGVMACASDPVRSSKTNVEGLRVLADTCRERSIPLAFASSLSVVGAPEVLPVTESTLASPTHEYARQKTAGEEIVRALGSTGASPAAILRMSNVYGSHVVNGRTVSKGNVLTMFLDQAKTGLLKVNAPGTQRRDFIHISDVVAHWQAVVPWLSRRHGDPEATVFDVASGEAYSILEVAELVRREWRQNRPHEAPLELTVVDNPREGVELISPDFSVSRALTEAKLGVECHTHVPNFLKSAIAAPASLPTSR